MKAIYKETVIAESQQAQQLGNQYFFPPESIESKYFQLSETRRHAPGKGKASYFHIQVGPEKKRDAAWFYPHPEGDLASLRNYVTFGADIEIQN